MFLQLPSPPHMDVMRDYAGGFGVAFNTTRPDYGHGSINQPVLSLVYAAGAAENAGIDITYIDAQAEKLALDDLKHRLMRECAEIIVATINLPSIHGDLQLLKQLKQDVGSKVIAIGTVCKVMPETVLEADAVDYAIVGDAEIVAPELVRALVKGDGSSEIKGVAFMHDERLVVKPGGKITDLGRLPMPPFHRLPLNSYRTWEFGLEHKLFGKQFGRYAGYFPLYFSRGCSYKCFYCPYPVGFGRRTLYKEVGQVVEELRLAQKFGIKNILFRDQTFSQKPEYVEGLCQEIVSAGLNLRWLCETRVDKIDRALIKLMKKAGAFRIHFGVETGDPELFQKYGKPGAYLNQVKEVLSMADDNGIIASVHFLLGFPDENSRSIEKTAGLIRELGIKTGDCAILTPYPGTALFDKTQAEGRLLSNDWADFNGSQPLIRNDHLSSHEMILARSYLLKLIKNNTSLPLKQRIIKSAAALRGDRSYSIDELYPLEGLAPKKGISS